MSGNPTRPSARSVEDLLAVVADRYGLNAPISARRLTGGYANDVFLLEGHDLVAHVKHPPADLESLSWEHRLLRLLADRLPEVAPPLPDRSGSTFFVNHHQPVWLTPFVRGSPAQPSRPTSGRRRARTPARNGNRPAPSARSRAASRPADSAAARDAAGIRQLARADY